MSLILRARQIHARRVFKSPYPLKRGTAKPCGSKAQKTCAVRSAALRVPLMREQGESKGGQGGFHTVWQEKNNHFPKTHYLCTFKKPLLWISET